MTTPDEVGALVFRTLRTTRRGEGLTEREVRVLIASKYGDVVGRVLKRPIAAVLHHGVDYGILTKKGTKYRFDLDSTPVTFARRRVDRKRARRERRPASAKRRRQPNRPSVKVQPRTRANPVPRPRVPRPPVWTPRKRNLREEPLSKVIKRQSRTLRPGSRS